MGGFVDDCLDVLKFSLSWVNKRNLYVLMGVIFGLSLLNTFVERLASLAGMRLLMLVTFPASILISAIMFYYSVKVVLAALGDKGFGTIGYGVMAFLRYLALYLLVILTTLFPWTDARLLVVGVVLFLGVGVSAVSSVFSVVAAIPLVIFLFLGLVFWAYNYVRLYAAGYLFLSGKTGIVDSVRKSWDIMGGKVSRIFGILFVLVLVLFFASFALGFVFGIGTYLVSMVENAIYGFDVVATVLVVLFLAAIQTLSYFISGYLGVGIYSIIMGRKEGAEDKNHEEEKRKPAPEKARRKPVGKTRKGKVRKRAS